MARFANVEVPADKQIQIALTYVYGVGPLIAKVIVIAAIVEPTKRTKDLTDAVE